MDKPHWDVADPRFLLTVLLAMLALGGVVTAVGTILAPRAFTGLLSGAVLASLVFLTALQGGRIALRTRQFAPAMLWLFGSQAVLWIGMAVLLVAARVDPVGFAAGVSVLPITVVVVTLYWWLVLHKGTLP